MTQNTMVPLDAALQAQKALRDAAGLETETFPIRDFVGMVSDEIERLRQLGQSDEQIASLIQKNSPIRITASEITENYASPEHRHPHRG